MNFEKDDVKVFHSSIRIHMDDLNIYFDPYKIDKEYHDANTVFITHSHFDHLSKNDLIKVINNDSIIVCPESILGEVEKIKFEYNVSIVSCNPGEVIVLDDLKVNCIPAYNILKPFHPKKNKWVGYIVEVNGEKIYVAGDTDLTEESSKVNCDIAFLPVGGIYTMDYKEAAKLANQIKPKVVIPIHYGDVAGTKEDGIKFQKLLNEDIDCKILIK